MRALTLSDIALQHLLSMTTCPAVQLASRCNIPSRLAASVIHAFHFRSKLLSNKTRRSMHLQTARTARAVHTLSTAMSLMVRSQELLQSCLSRKLAKQDFSNCCECAAASGTRAILGMISTIASWCSQPAGPTGRKADARAARDDTCRSIMQGSRSSHCALVPFHPQR